MSRGCIYTQYWVYVMVALKGGHLREVYAGLAHKVESTSCPPRCGVFLIPMTASP